MEFKIEDCETIIGREKDKGGQQVGMRTDVTVKHIPTGIEAYSCAGRNQHKNREICLVMIEIALSYV